MMITPEVVHESGVDSVFRSRLAEAAAEPDVATQLAMIDQLEPTPDTWNDYCREMHAFATGPSEQTAHSALVRATALERSARALYVGSRHAVEGIALEPDMQTLLDQIHRQVPGYIDFLASGAEDNNTLVNTGEDYLAALAVSEGVPRERVLFGSSQRVEPVPILTGMLLARNSTATDKELIGADDVVGPTFMRPAAVRQAAQHMLEGDHWQADPDQADNDYIKLFKLVRDSGPAPYEHALAVAELQHLEVDRAGKYAEVFTKLYDAAEKLGDVFPCEVNEQVIRGARRLVGNVLLEAAKHERLTLGKSEPGSHHAVTLYSGRELRLSLGPDEMLELLGKMNTAINILHDTLTDPRYKPVESVRSEEYTVLRFVDTVTMRPPSVKLYIRPEGEVGEFDRYIEHGRPKKGVEASISYTVQLGNDNPLPLAKKGEGADTISIRLDREAPDNPRVENGQLALDIGSILGPPDRFGTKVGLLVASANIANSRLTQEEPGLNHYRMDMRYGRADNFAAMGRRMYMDMRQRTLGAAELQQHMHHASELGRDAVMLARAS
jgi:hypothetical protein